MRSKLIILLLLPLFVFGQSVPNTTTFSLQNVYDAVNYHTPATTGDLQSCFDNSIASYFNATYGSKTMNPKTLYGFRDYKPDISIAYESTGGYWMSTQNTTDGVFVYPSGRQNNDILILVLVNKEAITLTTPTGWTQLGVINDASMSYGFYWRRVDGNEPINSVTMGTSAKGTIVYNYRGVSTSSSPYNVASVTPSTATSRGSSVSGNANDLAVEIWIVNEELTATGNSASGWVENYNNGTNGVNGFTFVAASYKFGTSPSTTPTYPNYSSYIAYFEFVLPN